jgi:hypothetical protein
VYLAGPPAAAGAADSGDGPLCVSRAERRSFDGPSAAALHKDLPGFLADLVRPYGLELRGDLLASGAGQSYGEMAGPLVAATTDDSRPVDLLILAFTMPDVWPERATASYLSHLCPGDPMAFAICDQGAAAAFTGLRLAREYARTAGCRRALLLIVEQAVLHYQPAEPVPLPARHAAVALLCEAAGPGRLGTVRQHAGVTPAAAGPLLAAELASLSTGDADVTLVIGHDLARLAGYRAGEVPAAGPPVLSQAGRTEVRIAPAGQPGTGVWWELAGGLAAWAAGRRRVLLAEYDPALRYLCVSAVDTGAGPPRRPRQVAAAHQPRREP